MIETPAREYHIDRPFYQADFHYYYPDIIKLIEPDSSILDIGCGNGILLEQLRDSYNCNVTGIDINLHAIFSCQSKNIPCYQLDIEENIPSFLDTFDYLLLTASLEHLIDPRIALNKISKLLNKNGHIIIAVPNFSFFLWRLYYLRGKNAKKFNYPQEKTSFMGIQSDGHLQFFTKETLEYLLNITGYTPTKWIYCRDKANISLNKNNFKGNFQSTRQFIHNKLWVTLYNSLPEIEIFSKLLIVKAQKNG